jgi:hypothetical protein
MRARSGLLAHKNPMLAQKRYNLGYRREGWLDSTRRRTVRVIVLLPKRTVDPACFIT